VPASATKDSLRSARRKASALAPGMRYSTKRDWRALKPLVETFAMLLAMTSSSRPSAIWRDRPMRSAFSMERSRCSGLTGRPFPRRALDAPQRGLGREGGAGVVPEFLDIKEIIVSVG
jgi:hypothetical protein